MLGRPARSLGLFAAVSAVLLVALGMDLVATGDLVRASSAAFVAVYAPATAAGVRLLSGAARGCAAVAFGAVLVILAFSGPFLLVPAAILVLVVAGGARYGRWISSTTAPSGSCR